MNINQSEIQCGLRVLYNEEICGYIHAWDNDHNEFCWAPDGTSISLFESPAYKLSIVEVIDKLRAFLGERRDGDEDRH